MQSNFKVLSLSHEKAPIEIRELLHLDEAASRQLAVQMREVLHLEEVLVLSTCNRTEIYFQAEGNRFQEVMGLLGVVKGITCPHQYGRYFEEIHDTLSAARHLFEVSMGLHSKVIGDLQISNQVKKAYAISAEEQLAGPFLHRLLHTIFHCNKRVQQETAYRDGAASVSYAAAELARSVVSFLPSPSVLVIGLGEMGLDAARNVLNGKFERIAVMNRSGEKAQAFAEA
ncbi:MAG: glutamyl-tRNA reductase, partial [Bacteroidota bacterium]